MISTVYDIVEEDDIDLFALNKRKRVQKAETAQKTLSVQKAPKAQKAKLLQKIPICNSKIKQSRLRESKTPATCKRRKQPDVVPLPKPIANTVEGAVKANLTATTTTALPEPAITAKQVVGTSQSTSDSLGDMALKQLIEENTKDRENERKIRRGNLVVEMMSQGKGDTVYLKQGGDLLLQVLNNLN